MRAVATKVSVILRRSMRKLGKLNDVVQVRKGFARHYLIPNKFACLATPENMQDLESQKTELETNDKQLLIQAEAMKAKMEGMHIMFYRKTVDMQNIYGSISAQNIAEKLAEQGFDIVKSQVLLGNNLRTLGSHEVSISLYGHIESNIIINIKSIADEQGDKAAAAGKN